MARSVVVEQSRAIPVTVEAAFGGTLPISLPLICSHWYGPIPPIKEVRDQTGAWDAAGQTRVVMMVGGGSVREELTSVDPRGRSATRFPASRVRWRHWSARSTAGGASRPRAPEPR